jgi:hypothetical protein
VTDDEKKKRRAKRIAIGAGLVLGLLCNLLPSDYQAACHALANLCTGGL